MVTIGRSCRQAFQSRITAGPIDTIEKDIALTVRGDERALIEARQQQAVVVGLQAECIECPIETLVEKLGYMRAFVILDEGELAIVYRARNSGKHLIELRQIFVKRLAAPIDDGGGAQSQMLPTDGGRLCIDRFIVDRQIGQPDQPFRVVILAVGRLHQIAAEVIVDCRKAAGIGMAQELHCTAAKRCAASAGATGSMPISG